MSFVGPSLETLNSILSILCIANVSCTISYHLLGRHQLRQAWVATRLAETYRPQLDIQLEFCVVERRSVLGSHDVNFANQPDKEKYITEYIPLVPV